MLLTLSADDIFVGLVFNHAKAGVSVKEGKGDVKYSFM